MTFFEPTDWDGRAYVGGWTATGSTTEVVNPATGEVLGRVGEGKAADVAKAVELAVSAQEEWAARPAEERAAVMRRAATILEQHKDAYAEWIVKEAGSGQGKAAFEVGLVTAELHLAAGTAAMPYGQLLQSSHPRLSMARRRPVGVVGVISPFNFPGILAMRSVAPALALGNAVVLKPDPRTAISGGLFLAAVLEEAGLPQGLLAVLPGGAEAGAALVQNSRVPVISFTGSTPAGRTIGEQCGRLLKRAHLELGGNNAMLVLPDVDVAAAASAGAWGSFLHQGQICMTTGRHIVHEDVYDEYVGLLAEKAHNLVAGDPSKGNPLGPIIDAGQLDKIHAIVNDSVAAGAVVEAGGTFEGLFYQPTVLSAVRPEHRAYAEEIFGPVAPVIKVSSVDEAVDLVNGSEYGLSVAVLAGDAFKAFELGNRIDSGVLHINDQTVDDESTAPFGGTKASGTGSRFGGHEANIEAFTETQWVTVQSQIQRYPF